MTGYRLFCFYSQKINKLPSVLTRIHPAALESRFLQVQSHSLKFTFILIATPFWGYISGYDVVRVAELSTLEHHVGTKRVTLGRLIGNVLKWYGSSAHGCLGIVGQIVFPGRSRCCLGFGARGFSCRISVASCGKDCLASAGGDVHGRQCAMSFACDSIMEHTCFEPLLPAYETKQISATLVIILLRNIPVSNMRRAYNVPVALSKTASLFREARHCLELADAFTVPVLRGISLPERIVCREGFKPFPVRTRQSCAETLCAGEQIFRKYPLADLNYRFWTENPVSWATRRRGRVQHSELL